MAATTVKKLRKPRKKKATKPAQEPATLPEFENMCVDFQI
jgi:hypothetical protein